MTRFVRYQSGVANRRGEHPGVFALVNGLASESMLTSDDLAWVRASNELAHKSYADPAQLDEHCYDPVVNPGARAWFKDSAADLIEFTQGYLELLDRYHIRWVQLLTNDPGRVVYEDDDQVVAVPYSHAMDWPFQR